MARLSLALIAAELVSASLPERYGGGEQPNDHFMRKDLPSDVRAPVTKYHTRYDFDHPYPILQEDHDYDADYVSDENDDGGEWKAQEVYDYLRQAIIKHKADVDRLKHVFKDHEKDYHEKKAEEHRMEKISEARDADFAEAKKLADGAADKTEDLRAQVAEAQGTLDREMSEMAQCRKELLSAKRALEGALGKHRHDDSAYDQSHGHFEKVSESVDDTVDDAEQEEATEENHVAKEKVVYKSNDEAYQAALSKVKATEALLEEVAAKLKRFRMGEDPDGGVYYVKNVALKKDDVEKAAVPRIRTAVPLLLAAFAATACA